MAPLCSDPSSGWVGGASPSRNPDLAGGRCSPLDFKPDIKSADAALQRINRANGGPTCTRDDIFDCFERIHRATEHLVDGVEYERKQDQHQDQHQLQDRHRHRAWDQDEDVRSEPELYSHACSREQMRDDADLVAMINVSQDILQTLRYVQDNNTNRQQQQHQQEQQQEQQQLQQHQQHLLTGTNHPRHHHRGSSESTLTEPISPRQSIARGQKRKQEQQQQQGMSHGNKSPRAHQPAYCRHCNCTETVKWRSGPDGLKTLCNVCGLLYAKRLRRIQRV